MSTTVDGGLVIGGSFTSYEGEGHNRLLKLLGATTGQEGLEGTASISLMPVPATDRLHLVRSSNSPVDLLIVDALGRILSRFRTTLRTVEIPLDGMVPGHYSLIVTGTDGSQRRPFIKL